jgi:hypothetical protein
VLAIPPHPPGAGRWYEREPKVVVSSMLVNSIAASLNTANIRRNVYVWERLNVEFRLQCRHIFLFFCVWVRPESPWILTRGAMASEAFVIHWTMWTRLATSSCVLLVRREIIE